MEGCNGRLFLAWTGTDNHLNIMSSADLGASWQNKRTLNETSPTEPSLVVFNGKLILMWNGTDFANHLNFIESGDGGLTWGNKITIGDTSGHHPAWLGLKPLPNEMAQRETAIEELTSLHAPHFPQLRRSLESADVEYIRRNTSKEADRLWREERRRILRAFLNGLAEDFVRVDQFARLVTLQSAHACRREELELALLSLRFRLGYRVTSMQITTGSLRSVRQVRQLTDLIGNLSARAESAMTLLEISPPRAKANGPEIVTLRHPTSGRFDWPKKTDRRDAIQQRRSD